MPTTDVRGRVREAATSFEVLFALLAGISGVAGSYAVAGYTRQFIIAPIDPVVVDLTPGLIVNYMIENVGQDAHLLHLGLSAAVATVLLAATALLGLIVARRSDRPIIGVVLATALAWSVTAAITSEVTLAIGAAAPVGVVTAIGAAPFQSPDYEQSRRRALASGAGAFAFLGLSIGLGSLVRTDESPDVDSADVDDDVAALVDEAETKSLDVEGDIPGLVSTFEEFYKVDIASFDPDLSAEDWSMTITGEVEDEVTVTFDELTDMPTERRFLTLRCVGERLNGKKLDNAVWTGTPIKPLLEEADPGGECGCAMLRARDNYFVQFPIEALEDGFLAWRMNGVALPKSHGHPVRVLVPGHWGETNVKWLTEIELLDGEMDGYWEQEGWHGTGPVNTVAKLWSDTMLQNGNVEVAGHAYAGTRGVDRVEVSIDGGDTWQDAELSEPLPETDVWRQWRYEFEPEGSHEVVVRAIDGEGTVQPEEYSDAFPSGSTGWVSRTVNAMDASSS